MATNQKMNLKSIFGLLLVLQMAFSAKAQTTTQNYVMSMTARDTTTFALYYVRGDETKVQTDITYVDGLGRNKQTVLKEATPGLKDLVTPFFYDQMGRMDKDALPYQSAVGTGEYRSNMYNEHTAYYTDTQSNGEVANVSYPYSKRAYETSPLSRVVEMSAPGYSWRPSGFGGTNVVTNVYRSNVQDGSSTEDDIRMFTVDLSDNQVVTSTQYYATGELNVVETKDEDGNRTYEFTDKSGQVVCKKAAVGTADETHTYYVYDIYKRLTFVIPPQAVEEMGTNWSLLNDYSFRDRSLFRYKYDQRNRMIEKQVPGAGKVEMVYDKRDRLVFTLDGNRRDIGSTANSVEYVTSGTRTVTSYEGKSYVRSPGAKILIKKPDFQASKLDNFSVRKSATPYPSEWLYTKYDELNRPVITGIKSMTTTRADLQSLIDNDANYDFSVSYVGAAGGNVYGYADSSYPSASGTEVLTVTYYDNYDFKADFNWESEYNYTGHFTHTRGQMTGGLTLLLDSSPANHLKSVTYYDDRLRPKAVMTENIFGKVDEVVTTYKNDVLPLVASTTMKHRKDGSTTTVHETFTYDHRDRLLTHTHAVAGNGTKTLSSNTYNALGQLIEKDLHDDVSPVQSVDYRYNERGWLTTINGGSGTFDDGTDQFGMELKYNNAPTPNFNGNIGQMLWKAKGGTGVTTASQNYQYGYDDLNRLKSADYSGAGNFDVSNITYDKNGNIETLQRNTIDNLSYDYYGNRLTRVEDATSNTSGFEDVSSVVGTQEYRYDKNGNMLSDTNKGITAIEYNYLNLPQQVTLDDNTIISYTYDAVFLKHRQTVDDGSPETTTYSNGFHYKDNTLQFLQHVEGRARYNSGSWLYEYNLNDHLGNVRVSVNESGDVVQRDGYYPFGGTFNSSATSPENLYKYQGYEQQKETDTYLTEFRIYDAWLGRWAQVDPKANEFHSPYTGMGNNPLLFIDPRGDTIFVNSTGYITRNDETDNLVYTTNEDGELVALGEVGGEINVDDIYANLLEQNTEEAAGMLNPFSFRNKVKNKGEWDLKNNKNTIFGLANHTKGEKTTFTFQGESMEAQDIGNHHFGAVGEAIGIFPQEFMLKQAGEAQMAAGTSRPEWQVYKEETRTTVNMGGVTTYKSKVLQPPYGDDPRDQKWIKAGFQYYNKIRK
ncbi:MAG: DUF6443 domain-containing protein [Cytophagales bacterium]|nr:DUF6443 domain-containing protein [Cytophagales bacterium]